MDKKTASRIWVELNLGNNPKELAGTDLSTHDKRWAEMCRIAKLASQSEVDRLWAESQGLTSANIGNVFGNQ